MAVVLDDVFARDGGGCVPDRQTVLFPRIGCSLRFFFLCLLVGGGGDGYLEVLVVDLQCAPCWLRSAGADAARHRSERIGRFPGHLHFLVPGRVELVGGDVLLVDLLQ